MLGIYKDYYLKNNDCSNSPFTGKGWLGTQDH